MADLPKPVSIGADTRGWRRSELELRSSPSADEPGNPHQDKIHAPADPEAAEMMTQQETCIFFGGPTRPIHYSTLYRGIDEGRYPKGVPIAPNTVRWVRSKCRAARQKLIDAPQEGNSRPRGRSKRSRSDPEGA